MRSKRIWLALTSLLLLILVACTPAVEVEPTAENDAEPTGESTAEATATATEEAAATEEATVTPEPVATEAAETAEPYPAREEPTLMPTDSPSDAYPAPEEGAEQGFVPPAVEEVDSEILRTVMEDAAARGNVTPQSIEVVQAVSTTWRDGSLGCPQPNMMYTQALVEGYWIILEADGQTYDYRVMQNGNFRLCENPPQGGGAGVAPGGGSSSGGVD